MTGRRKTTATVAFLFVVSSCGTAPSDPVAPPSTPVPQIESTTTSAALGPGASGPNEPDETGPPFNPQDGVVSADARAILDKALELRWEAWELVEGVTDQALYQFPNSGTRVAFVEQMRSDVDRLGLESEEQMLVALQYEMVDLRGAGFMAFGYFANLVVLVESQTSAAALEALTVIDNEWCCGGAP